MDGGRGVGLSLPGHLGTQAVEVRRVDQARRIARVTDTGVLAVDEKEGEGSPRIILVDDLLFLGVKLLQAGAVVRLQFFGREVDVIARVGGVDEVIGGNQMEPEGVLVVSILVPSAEGSESFEAADQRPSLCGAVGSTLNTEEEHPHLVARPGRLRDDLECPGA